MSVARGVVVVDASLAVKWSLEEDYTTEALAQLAEWQAHSIQPIVPCWFPCEVANVLFQRMRRGELTFADSARILPDILAAVVVVEDDAALALRAVQIAETFGQRHSYDAQYVALAEREGCECWTADDRFRTALHGVIPRVRWIGEYTPT